MRNCYAEYLLTVSLVVSQMRGGRTSPPVPIVSGEDVVSQLLELARFSDHPHPAVTRILFTPNDMLGRRYITKLMTEAGLEVREDSMGTIFGRWEGSDPSAGVVMTGSHADAIPLAGAYDGTLGVIGAISAVKALKHAGFTPKHPIEVLMFTSEEPTRFGLGCLGSRAIAGVLTAEVLDDKRDVNGSTLVEAARAAGYDHETHAGMLQGARILPPRVAAFVELHIEQGPLLEEEGTPVGVVTAIAAPAALRVSFSGSGGHAGGLLMPYRHDAGLAAAELALAVEEAALATGQIDTVGTTGFVEIKPNTVNSVPREAHLEIDVRDTDKDRRDSVVEKIWQAQQAIAKRRGVETTGETISQDPPASCSVLVQDAISESAKQLGLKAKKMVSRAYHDSLFMAQVAPTGMIFIPCRGGWSHRPDEYASPSDIENGVKVLALTLARLAGSAPADKSEL